MALHELQQSPWIKKKPFRLWRWNSARKGNYSGKWVKWQSARSGWGVPNWFEGWQTPLHMRLPKLRWFKRHPKFINKATPVSLLKLAQDERIKDWATIDMALLVSHWYCSSENTRVKILWSDSIDKALKFVWIEEFSAWAKKAIEAAWWSIS